ncbi:MAG: sigma-70 family RNA polymerase sigma factor [Acidobacteria bacterium]|nr:MAG: sigma-70 family RNA polymerase sigma factor [Acidobacteriota bacterium]
MSQPPHDVTAVLRDWTDGDPEALGRLMPLVFDELRTIARRYLDRESPNHTLQPTALVNEVYLKLVGRRRVTWENRAQFFGFAAELMRRILVDHARGLRASKRGGGAPRISLEAGVDVAFRQDVDVVALDDALKDLAALDPRQAKIVELRFFTGLTNEEVAAALGISLTTVKREWRTARLWLYRELKRR